MLKSMLWPAVEQEHGLCSKSVIPWGAEDSSLHCVPTLLPERLWQSLAGRLEKWKHGQEIH